MKFLCNTEFVHSGVRSYTPGAVSEISAKYAETLIALDPKKPLGALSFFTPVGEEAVNFMKTVKRNTTQGKSETSAAPTGSAGTGEGAGAAPKKPTKQELIAEAKNLGIQGADRMNVEELTEVIAAKKGEAGDQTTTPPTGSAGTGEGSGNTQ